jgi:hypothetical protein
MVSRNWKCSRIMGAGGVDAVNLRPRFLIQGISFTGYMGVPRDRKLFVFSGDEKTRELYDRRKTQPTHP